MPFVKPKANLTSLDNSAVKLIANLGLCVYIIYSVALIFHWYNPLSSAVEPNNPNSAIYTWVQLVFWLIVTQMLRLEIIRKFWLSRMSIIVLGIITLEFMLILGTYIHRDYVPPGYIFGLNLTVGPIWAIINLLSKLFIFMLLVFIYHFGIKRIKGFIIASSAMVLMGCGAGPSEIDGNDSLELFLPELSVDPATFPVQIGEVIAMDCDSIKIKAIVLHLSEEEGEKWVGMCFIHENKLFGRQIPNGIINSTCTDLLDYCHLRVSGLGEYEVIETFEIDRSQIAQGAIRPVSNYSEILMAFEWGVERRQKEQTPCDEGIFELNPVRECYFELEKIKSKK